MHETTTKILSYLREYINANGYAPVYREIADGCKLNSTSLVSYHISALEGAGYITRKPGRPRTIVLLRARGDG